MTPQMTTDRRDETDLERLTGELLRVVDETMQPEFVGLWLREPAVAKPTQSEAVGSQ
jgi:hypothetical protein